MSDARDGERPDMNEPLEDEYPIDDDAEDEDEAHEVEGVESVVEPMVAENPVEEDSVRSLDPDAPPA